MTTDPQWKILGMVVCSIMLLTVSVTLCIFIYCYKKGHIVNSNNNNNNNINPKNNAFTPEYNNNNNNHQDSDYRHPYNSQIRSPIPYGMMQTISPTLTNDDIIRVHDKATNTEVTISPLRPRDIRRGVWEGQNDYGGIAYRPLEPPRMVHRLVQVIPSEIDQIPIKQKNQVIDIAPKTIVRLPGGNHREYQEERHPHRVIESNGQYDKREEINRKSRKRQSEESVENIELPKKGTRKQRFKRVSVKHINANKQSDSVNDDFATDHFYQ